MLFRSLFSAHFELPNKFFSLKNRKLFLKTKNKEKKQLPNIIFYVVLSFLVELEFICFYNFY